mmetsp:Transcript_20091/g.43248  ORF Transcript_20091/g.43248 Transcript_20091/m.43248 type:complete len:214 (+) Transcript_20091:69-710(+)
MAFTNNSIVWVDSSESQLSGPSTTKCVATKSKQPKSSKKKSVRRVQFAQTKQVFYRRNGQFEGVPKSTLWSSNKDFTAFRADFMQESKKVARSGSFENEYIVAAHRASKDESSRVLDTALVARVEAFLKDPSRVGLERMAAKEVFREKKLRRKTQWDTLNEVQSNEEIDQDMKVLLMSKACEQISRPSVMFARYLAAGVHTCNRRKSIVAATA